MKDINVRGLISELKKKCGPVGKYFRVNNYLYRAKLSLEFLDDVNNPRAVYFDIVKCNKYGKSLDRIICKNFPDYESLITYVEELEL